MNGDMFSNGPERIKVILPVLLEKTFCHETSFINFNGTIGIAFDSEDPFTTNRLVGGRGYMFQCLIPDKCALNYKSMVFLHCGSSEA